MINVVAIMGRLTYDPELRTTPTGVSVVRFQVAVDRNFQRAGEERKADFIDVTAWRQTAEFVSKYFRKGSMIAVEGSIQTDNFTDKDGNKRKSVQVVASNVSFCGSKAESALPAQTPIPLLRNRRPATPAQITAILKRSWMTTTIYHFNEGGNQAWLTIKAALAKGAKRYAFSA